MSGMWQKDYIVITQSSMTVGVEGAGFHATCINFLLKPGSEVIAYRLTPGTNPVQPAGGDHA